MECAGPVEHLQEKRGGRIAVDLGCLVHGRAGPSMSEGSRMQPSSARIELAYDYKMVNSASGCPVRLCQGR